MDADAPIKPGTVDRAEVGLVGQHDPQQFSGGQKVVAEQQLQRGLGERGDVPLLVLGNCDLHAGWGSPPMVAAKSTLSSDLSQKAAPVARRDKILLQNATSDVAKADSLMLQKTTGSKSFVAKCAAILDYISLEQNQRTEKDCAGARRPGCCSGMVWA
jgi:hypothetical protein